MVKYILKYDGVTICESLSKSFVEDVILSQCEVVITEENFEFDTKAKFFSLMCNGKTSTKYMKESIYPERCFSFDEFIKEFLKYCDYKKLGFSIAKVIE